MNWQDSFVGPALACLNGPVVGHWGAMSVFPDSKPTTRKNRALSTFGWEKFSPKI